MGLLISLLYLLLHIAVVVLCAALIYWALRVFGIPMDPWVMNILKFILALIVIILIVSWFSGAIPSRGMFGRLNMGEEIEVPFRLALATFA